MAERTTTTTHVEEQSVRPTQHAVHGLTQRDLLMELREEMGKSRNDITYLRGQMDVLLSQKHDSRIEDLEKWRHRADGRMDTLTRGVPILAALIAALTGLITIGGLFFVGG